MCSPVREWRGDDSMSHSALSGEIPPTMDNVKCVEKSRSVEAASVPTPMTTSTIKPDAHDGHPAIADLSFTAGRHQQLSGHRYSLRALDFAPGSRLYS